MCIFLIIFMVINVTHWAFKKEHALELSKTVNDSNLQLLLHKHTHIQCKRLFFKEMKVICRAYKLIKIKTTTSTATKENKVSS